MRNAYGQVYRMALTNAADQANYPYIDCAFRGVIYNKGEGTGTMFSTGPLRTPKEALDSIAKAGEKFGVTDIRPWSGDESKLAKASA